MVDILGLATALRAATTIIKFVFVFVADDVALAGLFEEVRERRLVQEGCKKFGLHWFSQLVSEDGSTWADEIQDHKQHFNGSFTLLYF